MIISRTPYRISFFGGGTDYPEWYQDNNGQVLSTTIDKYIYITCRYLPPFFEHRLRLIYSKMDFCQNSDELKHPAAKAVLNYLGIKKDLQINYDGDLPARSGLGSSSSFTVGLLNALSQYKSLKLNKKQLSENAIYIEQKLIGESVGSQDQINAAYGGLNHIKFSTNGEFHVKPIKLTKIRSLKFQKKLLLFHTGIFRTADTVTKKYLKDLKNKRSLLFEMYEMVNEALGIIKSGSLDDLGLLLNESWQIKKNVSKNITNKNIDLIYQLAISQGALGGKLLGAGGGGVIIFYAPEHAHKKIKSVLKKLLYIPITFENEGSQIIYNLPQKQYVEEEKMRSKNFLKKFKELSNI